MKSITRHTARLLAILFALYGINAYAVRYGPIERTINNGIASLRYSLRGNFIVTVGEPGREKGRVKPGEVLTIEAENVSSSGNADLKIFTHLKAGKHGSFSPISTYDVLENATMQLHTFTVDEDWDMITISCTAIASTDRESPDAHTIILLYVDKGDSRSYDTDRSESSETLTMSPDDEGYGEDVGSEDGEDEGGEDSEEGKSSVPWAGILIGLGGLISIGVAVGVGFGGGGAAGAAGGAAGATGGTPGGAANGIANIASGTTGVTSGTPGVAGGTVNIGGSPLIDVPGAGGTPPPPRPQPRPYLPTNPLESIHPTPPPPQPTDPKTKPRNRAPQQTSQQPQQQPQNKLTPEQQKFIEKVQQKYGISPNTSMEETKAILQEIMKGNIKDAAEWNRKGDIWNGLVIGAQVTQVLADSGMAVATKAATMAGMPGDIINGAYTFTKNLAGEGMSAAIGDGDWNKAMKKATFNSVVEIGQGMFSGGVKSTLVSGAVGDAAKAAFAAGMDGKETGEIIRDAAVGGAVGLLRSGVGLGIDAAGKALAKPGAEVAANALLGKGVPAPKAASNKFEADILNQFFKERQVAQKLVEDRHIFEKTGQALKDLAKDHLVNTIAENSLGTAAANNLVGNTISSVAGETMF